jgi:hypothetical protein
MGEGNSIRQDEADGDGRERHLAPDARKLL